MFNRIPYAEEGWSVIIKSINDAAKHEGISQWRLEVIFQVGDGTGRVWRSWLNKKRVARQFTRERIIAEACRRGWINLSRREQLEAEAINDEAIYNLPNASPCPNIEIADPPIQSLIGYSARLAAAALIHDASRSDGKLGELRQWAITGEYPLSDGKDWKATVQKVRALIDDFDRYESTDYADQLKHALFIQLVLAYRRRGYN